MNYLQSYSYRELTIWKKQIQLTKSVKKRSRNADFAVCIPLR